MVEEADETDYWLTIFSLKGYGDRNELDWLSKEALELLKITASTFITLEIDNLEE